MNCPFCYCLKRNRIHYSLENKARLKSAHETSSVISQAPPSLSEVNPVVSPESDYARILDSSGDGQISVVSVNQPAKSSIENSAQATSTSVRLQQPIPDDFSELYAKIDKTKVSKKRNNAANVATSSTPEINEISTSTTPSSSVPLPSQTHTETTTNNHDSTIKQPPYYDAIIVRESLDYRVQRLGAQSDQNRQDQLSSENYYSSIISDRASAGYSELYAEITAGSASGTIPDQSSQINRNPRTLNYTGVDDDASVGYATIE